MFYASSCAWNPSKNRSQRSSNGQTNTVGEKKIEFKPKKQINITDSGSDCDLFQVYIKLQYEKFGKWSNQKSILSHDKTSGSVTVSGQNGKKSLLLLKIFSLPPLIMSLL